MTCSEPYTRVLAILFLLLNLAACSKRIPSPPELLEKSIVYHDPDNLLLTNSFRMKVIETRPNGVDRETEILCDFSKGTFKAISKMDSNMVEYGIEGNRASVKLNGSAHISEEQAKKYRATADRAPLMRNYYTYLYGLPMKLKDPGTKLPAQTEITTYEGKEVYSLRVTYDETVGSDIWYFYFDPETAALHGYRFYHDESKGDGEYITLEDEYSSGGVRLPRVRKWYTNSDNRHLGTDTLVELDL